MTDDVPFKSPHIQEALPDLKELALKAREVCNERKLAFVIIVHDADAVDSFISSNVPHIVAIQPKGTRPPTARRPPGHAGRHGHESTNAHRHGFAKPGRPR